MAGGFAEKFKQKKLGDKSAGKSLLPIFSDKNPKR